jgi:osmotically inducible lipoprotein OsmB
LSSVLTDVQVDFLGGSSMSARLVIPVMIAAVTLAGCGTTPGDRGLSGAGIGAATGAVVGAIVGGPVLAAAAIGAGAGALTGVATKPSAVNLGKPIWDH